MSSPRRTAAVFDIPLPWGTSHRAEVAIEQSRGTVREARRQRGPRLAAVSDWQVVHNPTRLSDEELLEALYAQTRLYALTAEPIGYFPLPIYYDIACVQAAFPGTHVVQAPKFESKPGRIY